MAVNLLSLLTLLLTLNYILFSTVLMQHVGYIKAGLSTQRDLVSGFSSNESIFNANNSTTNYLFILCASTIHLLIFFIYGLFTMYIHWTKYFVK